MKTFDFGGWATRNDLKCADGRTIRKDAFKDQDGQIVPLVYMHDHNDIEDVLGHALLENRDEGVYAYCSFNETDRAKAAREQVRHGDIRNLSIYANHLKQKAGEVLHGTIREVSLVLAGANPGAVIDFPEALAHSDEEVETEAYIWTGEDLVLSHADEEEKKPQEAEKEEPKMENEEKKPAGEKTVKDVFDSLSEEQKNVVYYMIGQALEDAKGGSGNKEGDGEEAMKHNVFDQDTPQNTLSHADMMQIFSDAKRIGSLREAVKQHQENGVLAHGNGVYNDDGTEQTYGIANIDYLFPDYRNIDNQPPFIKRNAEWVSTVMGGVHHTPFSRVKSMFANITMDEARAKGYVKGNRKVEEVFNLLKRTTDPQTVYKKQKIDRDDTIDITDFDVVAYLKSEMRAMLDEECARAILIGDGRDALSDDKIFESHIRPIATDDELYAIKVGVTAGSDDAETAKNAIRAMIKNRKYYKGSGNLTFFTTDDWLSEMLLLEDGFGHSLYKTEAELATKLRVNRIVTVPVLEGYQVDSKPLIGIAVDLKDYNVGADKGGAVQMFDDFDIDFNQMKYLIETRFSGALIRPYAAMIVAVGGFRTSYEAVAEPTGNPSTSSYYEREGDLYHASRDTSVKAGKTYYTVES